MPRSSSPGASSPDDARSCAHTTVGTEPVVVIRAVRPNFGGSASFDRSMLTNTAASAPVSFLSALAVSGSNPAAYRRRRRVMKSERAAEGTTFTPAPSNSPAMYCPISCVGMPTPVRFSTGNTATAEIPAVRSAAFSLGARASTSEVTTNSRARIGVTSPAGGRAACRTRRPRRPRSPCSGAGPLRRAADRRTGCRPWWTIRSRRPCRCQPRSTGCSSR